MGLDLEYLNIIFPQDTPDMGNESDPAMAWTEGSPDGATDGIETGQECQSTGTTVIDFQFTTKPRQVVELQACNPANGVLGTDGLLMLNSGLGHCGYLWVRPVLTEGPFSPAYWAATGPIAVPGGMIQLKSFQWGAYGGDASHGLQPMYETHVDDWTKDKMEPEGDTLVSEPGWKVNDSGKVRSDPVSYTSGTTPAVRALKLTSDNQDPADAIVRIESDQDSLKFPDTTVHFKNGKAQYAGPIASQRAFPGSVENIDANLTWSVSFDGGQTFAEFAWTEHNMFITLGPAMGYAGFAEIQAAPHITAARLNEATNFCAGETTPEGVIQDGIGNVREKIRHVVNNSIKKGQNPWHELDSPPLGLDCISVTSVPVAVILQAGVNVSESLAYPTSLDADASTPETLPLWAGDTTLEYFLYDGATKNFFEAFLFPVTDGGPTEAYTAAPVAGPFLPWTGTTTLPLPAIPEKQLAFTVMYQTLAYERAPRPAADPPGKRAGQQWWIDDKTGKAVLYGPFPIPNQ